MDNKKKIITQEEKILDAAYYCISTSGYANISLRQIAEEAGVALSQLHYYFNNKEGLLTAVVNKVIHKYTVQIEQHLRKGKTARDKTQSLINFFEKILKDDPGLFRLLYDFTNLALWSESFNGQLQRLYENLSNMIKKHILDNIYIKDCFKGYSPRALSRMILGTMFGTAIQVLLEPEEKEMPQALNAIQIIFDK
jgi:AcrR family transcriptional regulator